MPKIPRASFTDSTLAFLRDGYAFGPLRFEKLRTDIFQTRLMLQKTIFLRGEAAARAFYDTDRFTRTNAAPERIVRTLFGKGGVQSLDGETHRHRKAMLMGLLSTEAVTQLSRDFALRMDEAVDEWARHDCTVLFDALHPILLRVAADWAGVPIERSMFDRRTDDVVATIEGSGGVGPRHRRARKARSRLEAWMAEMVRDVRGGRLDRPEGTPLRVISEYVDPAGDALEPRVAAVEVLNLLRPIVAISRFITFCALALHEFPQHREPVAADAAFRRRFVDEVRRYYPFFPAVAARVRETFEWEGYRFEKGTRTLLDLYATDHHPRLWHAPETFEPDRFAGRPPGPFDLVPQGGGDYWKNHRCAGERVVVGFMERAVEILAGRMAYGLPKQSLEVSLSRIPALPSSRFIICDVKRR